MTLAVILSNPFCHKTLCSLLHYLGFYIALYSTVVMSKPLKRSRFSIPSQNPGQAPLRTFSFFLSF